MPILWPLKVPERGNAITQRKTLNIDNCVTIRQQPKHICFYFICRITQPGHYRFFSKPPKIPTQIKQYMPNFCTQKKSRNRKFQTQKNPSIIPVTWNPEYPPGPNHGIFTYPGKHQLCLVLDNVNNETEMKFRPEVTVGFRNHNMTISYTVSTGNIIVLKYYFEKKVVLPKKKNLSSEPLDLEYNPAH